MIYVTTGTHPVPFDRLIAAMEAFAGTTSEEVIIQAGASAIPMQHAKHLTFISWDESRHYIQSARVVVSQAGVGTLIDAISVNARMIVWPRLARYGEAANDHQLEIAHVLSEQQRVIMVNNTEELVAALHRDDLPMSRVDGASGGRLTEALRDSLNVIRDRAKRQ
jgi:UDP-N-acetylglucosamine transferase subunit ALG13